MELGYGADSGSEDEDRLCSRLSNRLASDLVFACPDMFSSSDELEVWQQFQTGIEEEDCDETTPPFRHHAVQQLLAPDSIDATPSSVLSMPSNDSNRVGSIDFDDGWDSDFEVVYPQEATPNNGGRSLSYGEWEDEACAIFSTSWKKEPGIVRTFLREMFEDHRDTHDLISYFLRAIQRKRTNKNHALIRIILEEFIKWKREKEGNLPKNAVLTRDHQTDILLLLTHSHNVTYIDALCSIFDLCTLPEERLSEVVKEVFDAGHLKEAVVYTYNFRIQHLFRMEKILLPIVALDQINLIEKYVEGRRELQEQWVSLLDQLCRPGNTQTLLSHLLSDCKWVTQEILDKSNSKLTAKQLHKLGMRFVSKYRLNLDMFPNMAMKATAGFMHHILHLCYEEGTITKENVDDLLGPAVLGKDRHIQLQLICELIHFKEISSSARWALRCDIPSSSLPHTLQTYMREEGKRLDSSLAMDRGSNSDQLTSIDDARYLSLEIPISNVIFVDRRNTLQLCWDDISKEGSVIGIDSEWTLVLNTELERLAVMQLAVRDVVYILDMIALPKSLKHKTLSRFIKDLFCTKSTIKLGYEINGDMVMLKKSWPFLSNTLARTKKLVDLKTLDERVRKLTTDSKKSLPVHPLIQATPTGNELPLHPVLTLESHMPSPREIPLEPSQPEASMEDTSPKRPRAPATGLSKLVEQCLGKPLNKREQLSYWERRPLTIAQTRYAALDAYCLLSVYKCLKSKARSTDPNFKV